MLEQRSYLFHVAVWPHGLPFLDKILGCFDSDPNIRVVHSLRQRKPKMKRLVRAIYSTDRAPRHHLVSKLHHLKSARGDVMHIFLRVSEPQFEMLGGRGFRHLQSRLISNLKWELRAALNPRTPEGGVGHNHVIHCSDNPFQAHEMATWLGIPESQTMDGFFRSFRGGVWVPWHLAPTNTVEFRSIPLEKIRASVWKEGSLRAVALQETPQFQFLQSHDTSIYERYIKPKIGKEMRDGQSLSAMQRVHSLAASEGTHSIEPIIVESMADGTYRILDGVHRAATLTAMGCDSIFAAEFKGGQVVLS